MKKPKEDIIDEIQKRRTQLLGEHGGNLERYAEHLREREKRHANRIVDQLRVVSAGRTG